MYKMKKKTTTQVVERVGNQLFKVNMMHRILVAIVYMGIKKQYMYDNMDLH